MRFFLHLCYKGTVYSGWQTQKSTDKTVQAILENALSKICKHSIKVHGCGRTDAGVHSSQYFAHLDLPEILDQIDIQLLNLNLPEDIVVFECIQVDSHANAQKDAILRTYNYRFHIKKQAFLNDSSFYYTGPAINFELLREGLNYIGKQQDFSVLCKRPDQYKNTCCLILNTELLQIKENQWEINITANRFLQGMVRLIIGNLIEIANGKRKFTELQTCFDQQVRPEFYTAAYPQGLFLSRVEYPYLKRKNFSQMLY